MNRVTDRTRIKYTKKGNISESIPILMGCEVVKIELNHDTKSFKIIDVKTGNYCFSSGKGSTIDQVKRKARSILIQTSSSLYQEIRKKKS